MPQPPPSPSLSWFWTALGCCAFPRPKNKNCTPNNRSFNWDAEGGYIPFRFQSAYRARWRREDRQARFEESRARRKVGEIENKAHEIEKLVEEGKGKGEESRGREGRCEMGRCRGEKVVGPVKGDKERPARNKVGGIEKMVQPVKEDKERRARRKRTKKYVHVHKMSMTEAHEIMERAIGVQGKVGGKSEKGVDKPSKDDAGRKVESRSVIGSDKKTCAGTGTSKGGHKVETEGTLDELKRNRRLKSRSVLGLSGVTLVE